MTAFASLAVSLVLIVLAWLMPTLTRPTLQWTGDTSGLLGLALVPIVVGVGSESGFVETVFLGVGDRADAACGDALSPAPVLGNSPSSVVARPGMFRRDQQVRHFPVIGLFRAQCGGEGVRRLDQPFMATFACHKQNPVAPWEFPVGQFTRNSHAGDRSRARRRSIRKG